MVAYALDRGIYVGSERNLMGYGSDSGGNLDYIQKRCRYLFVTGVSEIDAHDGKVAAPRARSDQTALEDALKKPDNGYCRLFGE